MEKHDNAELSGVHILVSEGGLREDGTQWRARARLDRKALMPMWRYAERAGVLDTDMSRSALLRSLTAQYERWWNIDIKRFRSKKQFLGYAGRYARRPPIAQHRFRTITRQEIRFVTKDTRTNTGDAGADRAEAFADAPSRPHAPRPRSWPRSPTTSPIATATTSDISGFSRPA